MKKIMSAAVVACMLLWGCGKSNNNNYCTAKDPSTEEAKIVAYSAAQGYTTTKDANGIYYQIVDPGTGVRPSTSSRVTVQYTGKLFDGTVFDTNVTPSGATFSLSGVIYGWQVTLPLIKVGGTIRILVPSAYAYGCKGSGAIPADSPLFFEIKLLAVN